jgi:hypothetical protein
MTITSMGRHGNDSLLQRAHEVSAHLFFINRSSCRGRPARVLPSGRQRQARS